MSNAFMSETNAPEEPRPEQPGGQMPRRGLPVRPASPPGALAEAEALFWEDLEGAARFFQESLSQATRRAYANGWTRFLAYCQSRGRPALPAAPETIAGYLSSVASEYADSTLRQHLAAIRHVHRRRFPEAVPPTKSALVENVLAGIVRSPGGPPGAAPGNPPGTPSPSASGGSNAEEQQGGGRGGRRRRPVDKAEPLRTRHLKRILQVLPGRGPAPSKDKPSEHATWLRGLRDRALLLVGFAGALRRSELSAMRTEDLSFRLNGVLIYIGRSKTDQMAEGEEVAIATGEHLGTCPVEALKRWLEAAAIGEGAVFRGVRRNGRLRPEALTGRAISAVVKEAAAAAGIAPGRMPGSKQQRRFSGHSLRAGHITEATSRGAPDHVVMQQSRHKDRKTFDGYVRPERLMASSSSRHLGL